MATCTRGCCFWMFFGLSMLCISGYLFFVGWWIPVEIHKHRLRYNQLKSFEIYEMDIDNNWYQYNIETQQITIISYKQHEPFNYKYFIGSWIDNSNINNNTNTNNNESHLINLDWNEFSEKVNDSLIPQLWIIQYSQSKCNSFKQCFTDYLDQNVDAISATLEEDNNINIQSFDEDTVFIYTSIDNEYKATNLNSELTSKILDDTRDGFQFIIMFILCIWFILILEFFDDNDAEMKEGWTYLLITIFLVLGYYLWILTLSIIPIFFTTPVYLGNDLDYWQQNKFSLTYTIGDYFAPWWISGVILHGIWQWSLVLLCPLCCCIYIVLLVFCCCNDQRTIKIGKFFVGPVIVLGVISIVLSSIGFIPIFIGNMTMWNNQTFPDMTKINENIGKGEAYNDQGILILQILIALGLLLVIIPVFACILTLITKNMESRQREEDTRGIHYAKRSFKKLPIVSTDAKYGKVEMGKNGGYRDEDYNVYT